jgi:hypothetical protein
MMRGEFMDRVMPVPMAGCWLWTGAWTPSRGYGLVRGEGGRRTVAHRRSWELHCGPIPAGMKVLHKCDVRLCVNPDHLFLGTLGDNNRDAYDKGRNFPFGDIHRPKTQCPQGHSYEGWNVILYQGRRYCRACMYARNKAQAKKGKRNV